MAKLGLGDIYRFHVKDVGSTYAYMYVVVMWLCTCIHGDLHLPLNWLSHNQLAQLLSVFFLRIHELITIHSFRSMPSLFLSLDVVNLSRTVNYISLN